jgi:alkylated DNA repair dioxygenase AlkB
VVAAPGQLFDAEFPEGFHYRDDLISADEEAAILDRIARVEFSNFEMRGVAARRRVAFFGQTYDSGRMPTAPLPPFLLPLRGRIAAWAGRDPESFTMALINDYPPGAPIGWHRDAPQYDIVGGVSMLSACRMRFRPYVSPATKTDSSIRRMATHEITLRPRSGYLMTGEARNGYEHHIPPVDTQRYSITFRTARS